MTASPPLPAAVAETHSGVVFFLGDRAYKAKKAVDLGFLDFTTVAARRLACHREVELNRRLAPDVYLGVADVVGPDGEACEHLVVMRRLPANRRLEDLARAGADLDQEVRDLAAVLASFHQRLAPTVVAARSASAAATSARWDRLVAATRDHAPASWRADLEVVERLAHQFLRGRSTLFAERIAAGRARDGHGDLLAEDIFLLDDGARILDCLDFDEDLRCGDVLADVAFLAMDLERLGRPGLARLLLDTYRATTADDWPSSLEHHHLAQRALVRASVGLLRAAQGGPRADVAARQHLDLARAHLTAGVVRVVVTSGLPGTGKSTLAAALAAPLDAQHLRTDDLRSDVVGRSGDDRYSPGAVDRVYGALLEAASHHLARGQSVVLDATWRSGEHRLAVEAMARALAAPLQVLECRAPASVAAARIEQRRRERTDPSEATLEVAGAQRATWTSWPGAAVIDTTTGVDASVAAAIAAVTDEPPERG